MKCYGQHKCFSSPENARSCQTTELQQKGATGKTDDMLGLIEKDKPLSEATRAQVWVMAYLWLLAFVHHSLH